MKWTIRTVLIIFSICAYAAAQENAKPCPTLEITGPSGVTAPGELMTFALTVSDPSLRKLTFDWKVSAGTIVEGQGTMIIKVIAPPDRSASNVEAKVTINGLPPECNNTATENSPVSTPNNWDPPDFYGQLSLNDEKARMQNAATMLRDNPDMKLIIIKYFPRVGTVERSRIKRLSDFLVQYSGLSRTQFEFVLCYKPRIETMIVIIPPNSKIPDCH